jgi:hypothetical protein
MDARYAAEQVPRSKLWRATQSKPINIFLVGRDRNAAHNQ